MGGGALANYYIRILNCIYAVYLKYIPVLVYGEYLSPCRTLRKWWKGLPLAEKSKVKEKLVYHRLKIAALVGLAIAAGIFNFATHIQEAPITKRRRYIAFTEEQFLKIARYELEIVSLLLRFGLSLHIYNKGGSQGP